MASNEYTACPVMSALSTENIASAKIDANIEIVDVQGELHSLWLIGMVYYGSEHFTARVINKAGNMWFHDGISTGPQCLPEGPFASSTYQNLWFNNGYEVSAVIYSSL